MIELILIIHRFCFIRPHKMHKIVVKIKKKPCARKTDQFWPEFRKILNQNNIQLRIKSRNYVIVLY